MYSSTLKQRGWYALSKNTLLVFILLVSIFQYGWTQSPDLPSRTSPIFPKCSGDITLTTQQQVDNYFNSCPNSKRPSGWTYNGSITLNGPNITNLQALGNLRTINGNLSIISTSIEVMGGVLQSSAKLTGNLNVTNNRRLGEVNLGAIVDFNDNGSIIITNNSRLTTITLPVDCQKIAQLRLRNNANLRAVRTNRGNLVDLFSLVINNNPRLQQFPSNTIRIIRTNLSINNTGLQKFDLTSLSVLKGDFSIAENPALTSIRGLVNLKEIGDDLTIRDNVVLPDLGGLRNIRRISGDLFISNNSALRIIGLRELQFVGGTFNINQLPRVRDLDLLTNLTTVNGRLVLTNNRDLSSIVGLKNITTLNKIRKSSGLVILDNPRLKDCCTVTQLLAIPTVIGNPIVERNGLGCSSLGEIRNVCTPIVTTCELLETIDIDFCAEDYSKVEIRSYRGAAYWVEFPPINTADFPTIILDCKTGKEFCAVGGFGPFPPPPSNCPNFFQESVKTQTFFDRERDCKEEKTDLELKATVSNYSPKKGDSFRVTFTVRNNSSVRATKIRVSPYNTCFKENNIPSSFLKQTSAVPAQGNLVDGGIWIINAIAPNASASLTYTFELLENRSFSLRKEVIEASPEDIDSRPLLMGDTKNNFCTAVEDDEIVLRFNEGLATTCDILKTIRLDPCADNYSEISVYSYRGAAYLVTTPSALIADAPTRVVDCETGAIFCTIGGFGPFPPPASNCPNFFGEGRKVQVVLNRERDCRMLTTCDLIDNIDPIDGGLCNSPNKEVSVYSFRGTNYYVSFPNDDVRDLPITIRDCNTGTLFCVTKADRGNANSVCPTFLEDASFVRTAFKRSEDCPSLTTCDLEKEIDICDPAVKQFATYSFRGRLYLVTTPINATTGATVRDCETGEIFCYITSLAAGDINLCPTFVESDATFVEDLRSTVNCPVCSCTKEFRPVCGSDGITYDNACFAECAGVAWTEGACKDCICSKEFRPVCGSDGITYDNACFAECAGVAWTDGACDKLGITCGEITIFTNHFQGSITIKGKPGEHYFFKVHRTFPKWERVFNCVARCGSEVTIPNLVSGTYYVDVYDKSWKLICDDIEVDLFAIGIGNIQDNSSASSRSGTFNTTSTQLKQPINIYPNPAQHQVTVEMDVAIFTNPQLIISNHFGQIVKTLSMGQYQHTPISLEQFNSGVYQISIVSDGQVVANEKLVVIK